MYVKNKSYYNSRFYIKIIMGLYDFITVDCKFFLYTDKGCI